MSAKNTFALLILAAIGLSCANKQQLAQVIVAEADRHLESGSLDAAIAAYERAIALDPKSIDPRLNLARTHASRGQYAMATEAVIAALDVEPSHPRGTLLLGQLHLAQQSYAEAVAALEEAQALLPGEFRPAFDLSLARLAVDGFIRGAVRPGAPPSGVLIDVGRVARARPACADAGPVGSLHSLVAITRRVAAAQTASGNTPAHCSRAPQSSW